MESSTVVATGLWTPESLAIHFREAVAHQKELLIYTKELIVAHDRRYEQKFTAIEESLKVALAAADKASARSETTTADRFQSHNEFRKSLEDQARYFIPRAEAEKGIESNSEKINILSNRFERLEGRSSGLNASWIFIGQLLGIALGVGALVAALMR